jgi:hypothetical protein
MNRPGTLDLDQGGSLTPVRHRTARAAALRAVAAELRENKGGPPHSAPSHLVRRYHAVRKAGIVIEGRRIVSPRLRSIGPAPARSRERSKVGPRTPSLPITRLSRSSWNIALSNTVLQLTNTDAAQSVVPPLCLLSVLAAEYHVKHTEEKTRRALNALAPIL